MKVKDATHHSGVMSRRRTADDKISATSNDSGKGREMGNSSNALRSTDVSSNTLSHRDVGIHAVGFCAAASVRMGTLAEHMRCTSGDLLVNMLEELSAHYGSHAMRRMQADRRCAAEGSLGQFDVPLVKTRFLCRHCGAAYIASGSQDDGVAKGQRLKRRPKRDRVVEEDTDDAEEKGVTLRVSHRRQTGACAACSRAAVLATHAESSTIGRQRDSPSSPVHSGSKAPCRRKRKRSNTAATVKRTTASGPFPSGVKPKAPPAVAKKSMPHQSASSYVARKGSLKERFVDAADAVPQQEQSSMMDARSETPNVSTRKPLAAPSPGKRSLPPPPKRSTGGSSLLDSLGL